MKQASPEDGLSWPNGAIPCDQGFLCAPGSGPPSELFWADEEGTTLLATDGLAERVTQAGCTGTWFQAPPTVHVNNGLIRYRYADGVREEILG